jgi:hypothetical protein
MRVCASLAKALSRVARAVASWSSRICRSTPSSWFAAAVERAAASCDCATASARRDSSSRACPMKTLREERTLPRMLALGESRVRLRLAPGARAHPGADAPPLPDAALRRALRRLRLRKRGGKLGGLELDQRLAGDDAVAVVDAHRHDAAGDGRPELDLRRREHASRHDDRLVETGRRGRDNVDGAALHRAKGDDRQRNRNERGGGEGPAERA